MDEFLREINVVVFKQWILMQKIPGCTIKYEPNKGLNTDAIAVDNKYVHAEVRFTILSIIELQVTNKQTEEDYFYLHFQMNNFKHALTLFNEFKEAIAAVEKNNTIKVLLSCSSGMTTNYFAMELNESAKDLALPFEFNAVSYNLLFHTGVDYDIILLAPQVNYKHAEVQKVFPHKLIIDIPTKIFAHYEKGPLFQLISDEIHKKRETIKQNLEIARPADVDVKILSIGLVVHKNVVRIGYRVYQKNKILLDNEIIKKKVNIEDINDIVNTVLVQYPEIAIVGISMPGVAYKGHIYEPDLDLYNMDILGYFESRYSVPFILSNDVNAIAVGLYSTQDKYENLSYVFQPRGVEGAGVGNIINGRLYEGRKSFAGEVKHINYHLSDTYGELVKTTAGNEEIITNILTPQICIMAPELIVVNCLMIPDLSNVINKVKEQIPEEYVPEIRKTVHTKDYMLIGQMILCTQAYAKGKA